MKTGFTFRAAFRVNAAVLAGIALFIQGCSSPSGHIYIDRPSVDTRERLINRRMDEQAWLEKQLQTDAGFSLQGSIDTREFIGIAAAVKGNFDPLGGASTQAATQNVQENARINQLEGQLQEASLKKRIELVQNWTNGNVPAPSTNIAGQSTPSTNLLGSSAVTINLGSFNSTNLPPLPNPSNRVLSASSLTATQTLDDKLAYRNVIQALLREQELDDTHDLGGMTLYTLKFDISVMPGEDNDSFGQVSLNFGNRSAVTEDDYKRWVKSLNQELLEECMSLERRYYMGFLSDEEKDKLFALAAQSKAEKVYVTRQTAAEQEENLGRLEKKAEEMTRSQDGKQRQLSTTILEQCQWIRDFLSGIESFNQKPSPETAQNALSFHARKSSDRVDSLLNSILSSVKEKIQEWQWLDALAVELKDDKPDRSGAWALGYLVQQRYQEALEKIATISESDRGIAQQSYVFFVCVANTNTTGPQEFIKRVTEIGKMSAPYVTVVEPKEYAQNISDVAAWERMISLSASLSALIPQAKTSVGLDSSFVKHSQQMLDTIKRQPLVVGFANGETNFGWILGPKFKIGSTWGLFGLWSHPEAGWAHTAIHYPVEASVVVPGWWKQVDFTAKNWWLTDKMEHKYAAGTNGFTARLPGDYAAITPALLAQSPSDQSPLQPAILPRWDPKTSRRQMVVREGKDENILIRGRDLWRNPQVFIGSQAASKVQVLPDMAGLLATFQNIQLPASSVSGPQLADLSVITSGGMSVLRDGVQILPDHNSNPDAFAVLQSTFMTNGGNLVFDIDPNRVPRSYGKLVLLISDVNGITLLNQTITNNLPASGTWQFTNSLNSISGGSRRIQVDLKLAQTPDANAPSVSVLKPAPKTIVYFATASEAQLSLSPSSLTFSTDNAVGTTNLTLSVQVDTNLFKEAFPDFEGAVPVGKMNLAMTNTVDKLSTNCPITGTLQTMLAALALSRPNGTSLTQTWTLQSYSSSIPGGSQVRVNPNLTVIWGK